MLDSVISYAQQAYWRGQIDVAIQQLKGVLAENPENPEAHALMALCLLKHMRLTAATYEIDLAIRFNPEEAQCYLIKAEVFLLQNKTKQALTLCDQALSLNPNLSEAVLLKGRIYQIYNDHKKAFACFNKAAALAPDNEEVIIAFASWYYNNRQMDKALEYTREALAHNPQSEDANIQMARIALSRGDIADAEYHAKFVIMHNPESEEALKVFCDIKMRQSFFMGLWWRMASLLSRLPFEKLALVLVMGYMVVNMFAQVLDDLGYQQTSSAVSYTWLAFCLYTWVGTPIYQKKMAAELEKFSFREGY